MSHIRLHFGADVGGAIGGRDDLEDQFWRELEEPLPFSWEARGPRRAA